MRPRSSWARGLLGAAALVTIASAAIAAPPEKKPEVAPPVLAHDKAPPVLAHDEVPSEGAPSENEALGRREAARVAAGRILVAVWASADLGNRRFTYSDPVGPLLAPYRLPVAPMASFGLEAYPFAGSGVPVLRDLGFRGRLSSAFAVGTKTPEGAELDTSWTRFGGELRQRFLVPGEHPMEFGVFIGGDASYFGMSTKAPVAALLPAARTAALRFGVDARFLLAWRLSFLVSGSYLVVTSRGEIYDRFRSPSVKGVDADGGFAIGLIPGLELRATGRYTRYFATFEPRIGDAIVAGGAVDQQLQFGLGARYAH